MLVILLAVVIHHLLEEPVVDGHEFLLHELLIPIVLEVWEADIHEVLVHVAGELDVVLRLIPIQVDEDSARDL